MATGVYGASLYQFESSVYYHLTRWLPTFISTANASLQVAWLDEDAAFPGVYFERVGAIWAVPEAGRGKVLAAGSFRVRVIANGHIQRATIVQGVKDGLCENPIALLEMSAEPYLQNGDANPAFDWAAQTFNYANVVGISSEAMVTGAKPEARYVELLSFDVIIFHVGGTE